MLIENGSKLVMIGDSVTDFGRARPLGEGLLDGIGKSYVGLVDALLNVTYPDCHIRVINMGTSGDNIRDLKARWQTDALDLKPDWLSILIGINDVWRQFDTPFITEGHVPLEEYRSTLEELVESVLPNVKGLVLMTPFFMEPNRQDPMRAQMDRYGEAVKEIARKHGTYLVDLQAMFDEFFKHRYSASITWDRIHPNILGHMAIAREFLNTIGFEWRS